MEENKSQEQKIRSLPNSFETEQSLLGSMLIDGVLAVTMINDPDDLFYNSRHSLIFTTIKELVRKDVNIDIITVNDALERSGKADSNTLSYLTELASSVPSAANSDEYRAIVIRDYTLRSLIKNCNSIIENAYRGNSAEQVMQDAESRIFNTAKEFRHGDLKHISSATSDLMKHIETLMKSKGGRGLKTGLNKLDFFLEGGLHRSDLIIIAARPSVGKTTIALNFLINIIKEEKDKLIAVFSLEMSSVQLAQRLLANAGNVPMSDINKGRFSDGSGLDQLWAASKQFDGSEVHFDDTAITTIEKIVSKCRKLSTEKKRPLDLVIIDYLQLMEGSSAKDSNRNQEIATISRKLKVLAKEMDCPVIAISQMSRSIDSRDDKEPKLSDLRESGSIEQDADIVMFLYREDETVPKEESPLVLEIAKHRNGQLAKVRLNFEGQFNRFSESTDQNGISIKVKEKTKRHMGSE